MLKGDSGMCYDTCPQQILSNSYQELHKYIIQHLRPDALLHRGVNIVLNLRGLR